jgi:hypothetical protein
MCKEYVKMNRQTDNAYSVSSGRVKPLPLGIDRIVETLSATLVKAGARKVEAAVYGQTARLAMDEKEMNRAFDTFGRAVAEGAAVTILGGLVAIESGEIGRNSECALLSVTIRTDRTAALPLREALTALRAIIWKHCGSMRLRRQHKETQFSLYLPVLSGT